MVPTTKVPTTVTSCDKYYEDAGYSVKSPTILGTAHFNKRTERFTLDRWKAYLDTCASHMSFFAEEHLRDVHKC